MITSLVFACGLAATILVALGVVSYLNGPLRKQLLELCGTPERVAFWAAFANVSVVLMPAIFAMSVEPDSAASVSPLIAIAQQLKWGFVGLITVGAHDGLDSEPVHPESTRRWYFVATREKVRPL